MHAFIGAHFNFNDQNKERKRKNTFELSILGIGSVCTQYNYIN